MAPNICQVFQKKFYLTCGILGFDFASQGLVQNHCSLITHQTFETEFKTRPSDELSTLPSQNPRIELYDER